MRDLGTLVAKGLDPRGLDAHIFSDFHEKGSITISSLI